MWVLVGLAVRGRSSADLAPVLPGGIACVTVEELLGTTAKRTGKRGAGAGAATAARTNSGIAGSQAARHRAGARLSAGQPVTNYLWTGQAFVDTYGPYFMAMTEVSMSNNRQYTGEFAARR